MDNKTKFSIIGCLSTLLIITVLLPIEGACIMLLWNWLMPTIFGLTTITFWQALGLSALSTILFKNTVKTNQ